MYRHSKPTLACLALIALLLLSANAGCGDDREVAAGLSQRRLAIFNGSALPVVGRLLLNGRFTCTATLIGQQTVLTAAHCFDNNQARCASNVSALAAQFELLAYGNTVARFAVTRCAIHDRFDISWLHDGRMTKAPPPFDVAVLGLATAVDAVQGHPLQPRNLAPALGEELEICGFGLTETGLTSEDLRCTPNIIADMPDGSYYYRFNGHSPTEGNFCHGDSGGPSFRFEAGSRILVGVHSTGSTRCGAFGEDGRLDLPLVHDWIVNTVAALGDEVVPYNGGERSAASTGSAPGLTVLGSCSMVSRRGEAPACPWPLVALLLCGVGPVRRAWRRRRRRRSAAQRCTALPSAVGQPRQVCRTSSRLKPPSTGPAGPGGPAASDQRPAASGQRPATSDQRPAASGQRPAASGQADGRSRNPGNWKPTGQFHRLE